MKKLILAAAAAAALGVPVLAMAGHVYVGVGIGGPGYYGYGPRYYGPHYYYGPGYYAPYYYGYAPYYYPPTEVYSAPETVVEQAPPAYWYYCPPAKAYYPYVQQCPVSWEAVPAQQSAPPPQAQQQGQALPPPQAGAQQPVPAPGGRVTYRLGDLLFASGQAELQPAATATLDSMLASINKDPHRHIVVEGHTDSNGGDAFNLELSRRRADTVRQYLIAHGVPADRISAVGRGERGPIADNGTPQGRQQNRRVDVIVG